MTLYSTRAWRYISKIIILLMMLSLCLGILPLSPQGGALAADGDSRFGLVDAWQASQAAWASGARWQRITMWWRELQKNGPNDWNNFALGPDDQIIRDAHNQGYELAGLLINTPDWAASSSPASVSVPKNLYQPWDSPTNYWGQFVRKAVARYSALGMNTFIIWNEPDIRPSDSNGVYHTWSGSIADYAQLLKVAYLNAKAVNPNVRILPAGLTYWTDKQYGRTQYFSLLLDELAKDPNARAHNFYFDVAALHLYIYPPQLYTVPNEYRQYMARYGLNKPIWINESNIAPYDDAVEPGIRPRSDMRATLEEQASFVIQGYAYALAAGVEKIELYKMKETPGESIGQALMRSNGSYRPEMDAFKVVTKYFAGTTNATYIPSTDGAKIDRVVLQKSGQKITALWTFSPSNQQALVQASSNQAVLVDKHGNERPIAPVNGVYVIPLERATCNTDQHDPSRYLVGGSPLLLVENTNGVSVTPASHMTNPLLAPRFSSYYSLHDGMRLLGNPLKAEQVQNGLPVQYFEKGRLEDQSSGTSDPNWQFQYGLLADELQQAQANLPVGGDSSSLTYAGINKLAQPQNRTPAPAGFRGGVAMVGGGNVFVPYTPNLSPAPGHTILGGFWTYINRTDLFPGGWLHDIGLPVTEPVQIQVTKSLPGGAVKRTIMVQVFQRTILTYDPANPSDWQIERANVGTDYLKAGGGK